MADNLQSSIVRDFRQTLLWPIQLMTDHSSGCVDRPWQQLKATPDSPWVEIQDEFLQDSPHLSETRYQEFVTFLPFAQRFLYGEGKHGRESGGYGESPIHIFTRSDINQVRITLQGEPQPLLLRVSHVELYFFFDIDVAMLAFEVTAKDLPLKSAMEVMYRLGRTYPNYWDDTGEGGH